MSKLCKRIARIINNRKNVEFEDIETVLTSLGYKKEPKRGKGSHCMFKNPIIQKTLIIPRHMPVKKHYIDEAIKVARIEEYYEENC